MYAHHDNNMNVKEFRRVLEKIDLYLQDEATAKFRKTLNKVHDQYVANINGQNEQLKTLFQLPESRGVQHILDTSF